MTSANIHVPSLALAIIDDETTVDLSPPPSAEDEEGMTMSDISTIRADIRALGESLSARLDAIERQQIRDDAERPLLESRQDDRLSRLEGEVDRLSGRIDGVGGRLEGQITSWKVTWARIVGAGTVLALLAGGAGALLRGVLGVE